MLNQLNLGDKLNSKVKIKIIGSNINDFILKINKKHINIYKIISKKNNICYMIIDYNKYDEIINIKGIYDVYIVDYIGFIKYKKEILKNKFFLIFLLIGLMLIFFLTRITYNVKIITNDANIKKILEQELKENGIYKYSFLKSYQDINKIKNRILKKYQDTFEWLEIEKNGTSYYVRFEPRLMEQNEESSKIYNIVAKKDARILKLDVESGQIIKNINQYVNKGEVIVSSDIKLNDEVKNIKSAKGKVFGEVWYKVRVVIPLSYQEQIITDNYVNTYGINFLNKKIVFDKSLFSDKIIDEDKLIGNNIINISFNKVKITEVKINKNINFYDKAIDLAYQKINNKLKDEEKIIDYVVLSEAQNDKEYLLDIFISVEEEIGIYEVRSDNYEGTFTMGF